MDFQTKIPLQQQQHNQIDYHSKLLLLGSCFAENIGEKLEYFKFQNALNPFGILFHPIAIENLITHAVNEKEYTEANVFINNERWHSYDAHSKLSNTSKEDVLRDLNSQIRLTNTQIHEASHIIITLGTAWIYRNIESDKFVANCHKMPQKKFLKEILSVDDITESLNSIIAIIKSVNKSSSIIFTVSPIRHIKDGFVENNQSKSHLLTAVHEVVNERNQIYYFHSYEIMMDELRDYRFYDEDMLHPNKTAINYIWKFFTEVWMSSQTQTLMKDVAAIQKGMMHKSFNNSSDSHQQFLQKLDLMKESLKSKIKHITF